MLSLAGNACTAFVAHTIEAAMLGKLAIR
jgi:hypothetical protein